MYELYDTADAHVTRTQVNCVTDKLGRRIEGFGAKARRIVAAVLLARAGALQGAERPGERRRPRLDFDERGSDVRHPEERSTRSTLDPPLLRLRLEPGRRADAPPVPERAPGRGRHPGRLPPRLRGPERGVGRRRGDGGARPRGAGAGARVGRERRRPRAPRPLRGAPPSPTAASACWWTPARRAGAGSTSTSRTTPSRRCPPRRTSA